MAARGSPARSGREVRIFVQFRSELVAKRLGAAGAGPFRNNARALILVQKVLLRVLSLFLLWYLCVPVAASKDLLWIMTGLRVFTR